MLRVPSLTPPVQCAARFLRSARATCSRCLLSQDSLDWNGDGGHTSPQTNHQVPTSFLYSLGYDSGGGGGGIGHRRHSGGKSGTWGFRGCPSQWSILFFPNFEAFQSRTTFGGWLRCFACPGCSIFALCVPLDCMSHAFRTSRPLALLVALEYDFVFCMFCLFCNVQGQGPATLRLVGSPETSGLLVGLAGTGCQRQVCLLVALFLCSHGQRTTQA